MKLSKLLLPLVLLAMVGCGTPATDSSSVASSEPVSSASESSISSSSESPISSVSSVASESSSESSSEASSSSEPEVAGICPANDTCVILPLGDSITDGIGTGVRGGGYRVELFRLATEAGHDITYIGNNTPNGPDTVAGLPFPKQHEGHSGWAIFPNAQTSGISSLIPENSPIDGNPHIILLHIGTNEAWSNAGGDTAGLLDSLVGRILTNNSGSLLAVSTIIPWPGQDGFINGYNQQIPGVVQKYADMGYNIIFVDQHATFPSNGLSSDGVHPNDVGYDQMGLTWYEAIEGYLN